VCPATERLWSSKRRLTRLGLDAVVAQGRPEPGLIGGGNDLHASPVRQVDHAVAEHRHVGAPGIPELLADTGGHEGVQERVKPQVALSSLEPAATGSELDHAQVSDLGLGQRGAQLEQVRDEWNFLE
jgi:hypothetical protein